MMLLKDHEIPRSDRYEVSGIILKTSNTINLEQMLKTAKSLDGLYECILILIRLGCLKDAFNLAKTQRDFGLVSKNSEIPNIILIRIYF